MSSRDSKERVNGKKKDEDLGHKGQVVVHEAALLACVESWPCSSVDEPPVQSGFEDVLSATKKEYKELWWVRGCSLGA